MNNLSITTWNVNSIKARLPRVIDWIKEHDPDVLCLQEIKCQEEQFPFMEIQSLGYSSVVSGQKSYNGVAVLTKDKAATVRHKTLPGNEENPQARYLEIEYNTHIIASIYVPNGNPIGTEKFSYKLNWMKRLYQHIHDNLLYLDKPVILCGDYNVIPEDRDCHLPQAWQHDALFQPESRQAWRAIQGLGFIDAYAAKNPVREHAFTFWDYTGGSWFKDEGIRIDHFLINAKAADRLIRCSIDKDERGKKKASDHVPVTLHLNPA